MRYFEDVILRPFVTEKSNLQAAEGKYTFIVNPKSNKTEIKAAVETLFKVKVLEIGRASCRERV